MKRRRRMTHRQAQLLALLEGRLSPETAASLQERLACDPELRREYETLRQLLELLREARQPVSAPGRAERVLAQLQQQELVGLSLFEELLPVFFIRTALVSLLLLLLLGFLNVQAYHGSGLAHSFWEALLGLPAPSLLDAWIF